MPAPKNSVAGRDSATEKDYPITVLWIFKWPIICFLINLVALFFGYWFPYLVLAMIGTLIYYPFARANFHYALEDKFLIVKQGVFSKKERHLPYGVIQNVFVKQDLFDRIFGLASLKLENAVPGGKNTFSWSSMLWGRRNDEALGSSGGAVSVPGMRKQNAEKLKAVIMEKIKINPIDDSQSGL